MSSSLGVVENPDSDDEIIPGLPSRGARIPGLIGHQRPQVANNITPITIGQVRDAIGITCSLPLVINDTMINEVKIVGLLSTSITSGGGSVFILEDATGTIPVVVRLTIEGMQVTSMTRAVYVAVTGVLSMSGGQLSITASSVRIVMHIDDLTAHFISVVRGYLTMTVFPGPGTSTGSALGGSSEQMLEFPPAPPPSPTKTPARLDDVPFSMQFRVGATLGEPFSQAVVTVIRCLHARTNEMVGVNVEEIAENMHLDSFTLKPYLHDLVIAGDICTTISGDYFIPK